MKTIFDPFAEWLANPTSVVVDRPVPDPFRQWLNDHPAVIYQSPPVLFPCPADYQTDIVGVHPAINLAAWMP